MKPVFTGKNQVIASAKCLWETRIDPYYFFADKTVREFFLVQKNRYIVVPSVLVFGTGILFAINIHALSAFALLFYFIWQTFHYQRQNYGILAFMGLSGFPNAIFWPFWVLRG